MYAFGVSASFTDTVVYYTEIQLFDSVQLDKTASCLKGICIVISWKTIWSWKKSLTKNTCMIYFSENKVKLNKEMAKIVSQYKKNKSVALPGS